jgi:hypothetical protein
MIHSVEGPAACAGSSIASGLASRVASPIVGCMRSLRWRYAGLHVDIRQCAKRASVAKTFVGTVIKHIDR